MDDQNIELYNSSALETLNRERKIVSSQGEIDFNLLDTFYQENKESLAHLGGKSSLLMTAFWQMNSINVENVNKIEESMRRQENDLPKYSIIPSPILRTSSWSWPIKSTKWIPPLFKVVAEKTAMIRAESSHRLSSAQTVESQLSFVATHFNKLAPRMDDA